MSRKRTAGSITSDNTNNLSLPTDAGSLLPHREPIRFIDRLIECTEDSAVAEATLTAENILADGKNINPVILVELMAQAYAAFKGYAEAAQGTPVRKGFLVGIRDLAIAEGLFVGDKVVIKVKTSTIFGAFALIEGAVFRNGVQLAAANLKLWVPDEPSQDI